jgi:hypothetical protein
LDHTDMHLRFAYIGSLTFPRLGVRDHLLYAVLFDAEYVGLDKYGRTAIIKQRRLPGEPRVDPVPLRRGSGCGPVWSASSDASSAPSESSVMILSAWTPDCCGPNWNQALRSVWPC